MRSRLWLNLRLLLGLLLAFAIFSAISWVATPRELRCYDSRGGWDCLIDRLNGPPGG